MAKQNNNSDLALNLPLGITLSIGEVLFTVAIAAMVKLCLLYTSPSPRD